MKEKIIGVLGLGIFGQTLAKELSQFGQEVIALDTKAEHIQLVADEVSHAAIGILQTLIFSNIQGLNKQMLLSLLLETT